MPCIAAAETGAVPADVPPCRAAVDQATVMAVSSLLTIPGVAHVGPAF
jgi:hypothetical protein